MKNLKVALLQILPTGSLDKNFKERTGVLQESERGRSRHRPIPGNVERRI